jgi:hypothetical protein
VDTNNLQHLTDEVAAAHAAAMAEHRSRRGFLRAAIGLSGLAAGAAATSGSLLSGVATAADDTTTASIPVEPGSTSTTPQTSLPASTTVAPPRAPTNQDLVSVAFLQSIEQAIVQVYRNAEASAKLDPAVLFPVATFREHHTEYGNSFTALAGTSTVGATNQTFLQKYAAPMLSTSDPKALLEGLLKVEQIMTATYQSYLPQISSTTMANLVASIMALEARHAVVLGQALGQDATKLVPSFQNVDGACTPATFPIVP